MAEHTRIERDSLGEKVIPAEAYYGIQTLRARENFPISGTTLPTPMVRAIALLKLAAARVHGRLGELDQTRADAVAQAAREVLDGKFDDQFVVDAFQAGAGTSFHMNANEVIANRAIEILGGTRGDYDRVSPNDHVNQGQSTNDVFPTAMRLATLLALPGLLGALDRLAERFEEKADAFARVIKSGRTHLQDAVPVTLGQEFGAYARTVHRCRDRLARSADDLLELGIGGSAAGTGMNTLPRYRFMVVEELGGLSGLPLRPAPDLFEAMQSLAPFGDVSAQLRGTALELTRITNDIRLLSSGPRTGLGEIRLPAVQPGSSIMPGKVNPSIPEMFNQVCFQVLGNDAAIAYAVQAGQLELNVMMPLVAHNLLGAIRLLENGIGVFDARCVAGIEADREACESYAMRSMGLATALNPLVGYLNAADVVKRAVREGRSIPDVVIEQELMSPEEARELFSPERLTRPGRLARRPVEFASAEPAPPGWAPPAHEDVEPLLDAPDDDIPPP